jgi:methyl-accepting chemotaxis protein
MKTSSIQKKLLIGLGLIVAFFLLQAALVWFAQERIRKEVVDEAKINTLASADLSKLAVLAQQIRRYEKEYFVYVSNSERRANYEKEWTQTSQKIAEALQQMQGAKDSPFNAADKGLISSWIDANNFYGSEMGKIFAAVKDKAAQIDSASQAAAAPADPKAKPAAPQAAVELPAMLSPIEANGMITAGKDRFSGVLIKGVADMSAQKTKATLGLSDVANEGFRNLLYGVLGTVVVGVLLALFLLKTLPEAVTKPLSTLTESVDAMSKGNLELPVDAGGVVEFEGLAKALDRMRVGQQALVARMRRG